MRRWRDTFVLQWATLLAVLVGLPWFGSGFVLAYDMVWVPELSLRRADVWGLGSALPRAVPSDAVVALMQSVLAAEVVQRVVLLGALVLAGCGGARLVRGLPLGARVAACTLALWNPYVAERLALGQWPLVVAYAALLWLVAELLADDPRRSVVALCLVGTALTPVSGLMGLAACLVLGLRHGVVGLVLLAALANAPWVAAGLLRTDALPPDLRAVRLFELQPEGILGRLGAALSLGGVWNADVVPTSRTLAVTAVVVVLTWLVVLAGLVRLARVDRGRLGRLLVLGLLGLAVACSGWLAPDLLERVVEAFAPAALLRDGTRWLALLAPLLVVGLGHGVALGAERLRGTSWQLAPVVLAVMLPLAALPDLALGVCGRLTPVDYPDTWPAARAAVRAAPPGDVLVLPFTAYRAPAWNEDRPVLDPAGRFLDRDTVVADTLLVSGVPIRGEDPRALRVRRALAADEPARELAREGIGVVVLDTTAPGAPAAARTVRGLRVVGSPAEPLRVLAVPGARERAVPDLDRWAMVAAWTAAGLVLLLSAAASLRSAVGGRRGAGGAGGRT